MKRKLGADHSLSTTALEDERTEFLETPRLLIARNAISNKDVLEVCLNKSEVTSQSHVFSNILETEGKATAQKSTGRCWLFAFCNTLRQRLMTKLDLPLDFEISQPYLFFYDKLEKANFFLNNIIKTAKEDADSRIIQHLLQNPVEDGGQYSMVQNLVKKYGLCPKSVYPETFTSSNSRRMRWLLTTKLREFARTLREMISNGATEEAVDQERESMMKDVTIKIFFAKIIFEVHRMLLVFFGEPPKEFDWCYRERKEKKKAFVAHRKMNPQAFYEKISEVIGFKIDDQISLVHDPRNEPFALLSVEYLSNMSGGESAKYVNVPIDVFKEAAASSIRSNVTY